MKAEIHKTGEVTEVGIADEEVTEAVKIEVIEMNISRIVDERELINFLNLT